jgi:hypothetical protein
MILEKTVFPFIGIIVMLRLIRTELSFYVNTNKSAELSKLITVLQLATILPLLIFKNMIDFP